MGLNDILRINEFKEEIDKLNIENYNLKQETNNLTNENYSLKQEINNLRNEIYNLKQESNNLINENYNLKQESNNLINEINNYYNLFKEYQSVLTDEHYNAINIKNLIQQLNQTMEKIEVDIKSKKQEIKNLNNNIKELKKEVIELDDEILYQSFGLYTPKYNFASSSLYKLNLDNIRNLQKEMIKEKKAVICPIEWKVDGSSKKGKQMINNTIKQILKIFNLECENAIGNVKFNNYDSMIKRIEKSFLDLNKLNEMNQIYITNEFLNLKYQEINLALEYAMKKEEEKEQLRILKEQQKEEAKLLKEIEDKKKEIRKEQQHYQNEYNRVIKLINNTNDDLQQELLEEKKQAILDTIEDLDVSLNEVNNREVNQKAGYVYIISNIGAFGENIFKIGMTRRLDPQERINELSGASVPFKFDIHALIFSEDAPALEASLHRAFESRKVNLVNTRKEFFNATLDEIKYVINMNFDKTVEFIDVAPAQEYRESLKKHLELMNNQTFRVDE